MSGLVDIAIVTIFAREMLEGTIIMGQYKTVIMRSPEWQDPQRQKEGYARIEFHYVKSPSMKNTQPSHFIRVFP